jgi:uncharacterized pyridoxamine 5'-phosphate oxidase family protein
MEEVLEFMNKCPIFYLGMINEKNRPHIRPFGLIMEWNGKLAFYSSTMRSVYHRQLRANPYVEISALMPETAEWMRICGKVGFTDEIAAKRKMLETMPGLQDIYQSEDHPGLLCIFIEEGEAAYYLHVSSKEPYKVIKI